MTTIGIATIPGREQQIERVCRDLSVQADRIVVYANQYRSTPSWVGRFGNVVFQTGPDLSDGGKFTGWLWGADGYVLTCDDDLYYPTDYVEKTIEGLAKYGNGRIVSWHGNVLAPTPIESYYCGGRTEKVRCLDEQKQDQKVNVCGSGVAGWWGPAFAIHPDDCLMPCMADLWMAVQAQKQRVGMTALAHPEGWIRQQDVEETIYERYWLDDSEQTHVVNTNAPWRIW